MNIISELRFTWNLTDDVAVADENSKPRTEMKMDDNFMTSLRLLWQWLMLPD
jgi:hypothetical protein